MSIRRPHRQAKNQATRTAKIREKGLQLRAQMHATILRFQKAQKARIARWQSLFPTFIPINVSRLPSYLQALVGLVGKLVTRGKTIVKKASIAVVSLGEQLVSSLGGGLDLRSKRKLRMKRAMRAGHVFPKLFSKGKKSGKGGKTSNRAAMNSLKASFDALEPRTMLAANVYVDDAWTGLLNGAPIADVDPVQAGAQPGTFGTDAFATIQDGIANVDPAGNVRINDGDYSGTLDFSTGANNIHLIGQSTAGVFVSIPSSSVGTLSASVPTNKAVSINNVTFHNEGIASNGLDVKGTLTLTNSVVDLTGTSSGIIGINVDGSAGNQGDLTMSGSKVLGASVFGVNVGGTSATAAIDHSEISIRAGATADVHVSAGSATIKTSKLAADALSSSSRGVLVDSAGTASITESDLSSFALSGGKAVTNAVSGASVVNASANWWGSNSVAGVQARVEGNVDITPFLNIGTDTDSGVGFVGNFSYLHVLSSTQSLQSATSIAAGRIQEALDYAATSGTVYIHNGIYLESNITVTDSVTVEGESQAGTTISPDGTDSHTDDTYTGARQGFIVNAANVTIKKLTIDGGSAHNYRQAIIADTNSGWTGNLDVDAVTVKNIYRKGIAFYGRGVNHTVGNSVTNSTFDHIGDTVVSPSNFESVFAVAAFQSDLTVTGSHFTNSAAGIGTNHFGDETKAGVLDINNNDFASFITPAGMPAVALDISGAAKGSVISSNQINMTGGSTGGLGIVVQYASNSGTGAPVTVKDNTVTLDGTDVGVLLYQNTDSTNRVSVDHNTITGTSGSKGILVTGNGAIFGESANVGTTYAQIIKNTIQNVGVGIEVETGGANDVDAIIGGASGNQNLIKGTGHAGTGVLVSGANASATVQNNSGASGSIEGFAKGVSVVNGGQAAILGNEILDNTIGVELSSSGTATINSNDFEGGANDNGTDVALTSTAGLVTGGVMTGNKFAGTTFINNASAQNITALRTSAGTNDYQTTDDFAIENRIVHKIDNVTSGLVTWVANTIFVTPASSPTATDNDYTRIQNAVLAAGNSWTIELQGSFSWAEVNAAASYEASVSLSHTTDIRGVRLVDGVNGLTIKGVGTAVITGRGDYGRTAYDAFIFSKDTPSAIGSNNLTITGLTMTNFESAVMLGWNSTGIFNNTLISNNIVNLAGDDDNTVFEVQNIAFYLTQGTGQTVTGNKVYFAANGTGITPTSYGYQSSTTGGTGYNNLTISNNEFHVVNAGGEKIIGVWENGHAHNSNVTVSGNKFFGLAANTGKQTGFIVTSHSGAGTTVEYKLNIVSNVDIGIDWLDQYDSSPINYTGTLPIQVTGNTLSGIKGTGVRVGGINASATLVGNTITGTSAVSSAGVAVLAGATVTVDGSSTDNDISGFAAGVNSAGTVTVTSNPIHDNYDGVRVTAGTATLTNNVIESNDGSGINVSGASTLNLSGGTVKDNTGNGLAVTGDGIVKQVVNVTGTSFENNSHNQPVSAGFGDITLFNFASAAANPSTASFTNVNINSNNSDYAIQVRGSSGTIPALNPATSANVTFDNVHITGTQQRFALLIQQYATLAGFSFVNGGVNFDSIALGGLVIFDAAGTLNLGNSTFQNSYTGGDGSGNGTGYDIVTSLTNINATNVTFVGADKATLAGNFAIEDRVAHSIDADAPAGTAFVDWIADNVVSPFANAVFLTTESYFAPVTLSASVQRAVNSADAGDTVYIQDGTYIGQTKVNKNLTISGQSQSGVTLQAPNSLNLDNNFNFGARDRQSVLAITGGNVKVETLTIDGAHKGATVSGTNPDFHGIGIYNADATIDHVTVKGVIDSSLSGAQRGRAIFAGIDSGTHSVTVTDSTVTDFQKNAIDMRSSGTGSLTATITGNTITGFGATGAIAQNGIVFVGATGTISDNTISDLEYTGSDTAAGILLAGSSGNTLVSENKISNSQSGINTDSNARLIDNEITGSSYAAIVVSGGSVKVEGNTLRGDEGNQVGLLVEEGALVDAGGGSLGSTGFNDFIGYNGASGHYAIENLNLDADGNVDVSAKNNYFGSIITAVIEQVVFHTVDDSDNTLVDFSNPIAPAYTPLPPTVVYVNIAWLGSGIGSDKDGLAGEALGNGQAFGYDQFASIQDAINAVAAGGTIYVYAGTYVQNLVIDKTVKLFGEDYDNNGANPGIVSGTAGDGSNDTIIKATISGSDVIFVSGADVEIAGLTIVGLNGSIQANVGISTPLATTTNLKVHDNKISDLGYAGIVIGDIFSSSPSTFTLSKNTISNTGAYGIATFGGDGQIDHNQISGSQFGVLNQHSYGIEVDTNTISGTEYAIYSINNGGNGGASVGDEIKGNIITAGAGANSMGIVSALTYVDVSIHDNSVSGVKYGLAAQGTIGATTKISFEDNIVSVVSGGVGALVESVDLSPFSVPGFADTKAEFSGDSFTGGAKGILVDLEGGGISSASIQSVTISGATIGIDVNGAGGTASASITGNEIFDNGTGIRFVNGGYGTVMGNNFNKVDYGPDLTLGGGDDTDLPDNDIDIQILNTGVTIGQLNEFAGDTFYIDNQSSDEFNLYTGAGQLYDETNNFRIEDKMHHKMDSDNTSAGRVTWVAGQVFVTNPAVNPTSTDSSIQRGVDVADAGWIVNVEDGTYSLTSAITINKQLTLRGAKYGVDARTRATTGESIIDGSSLVVGFPVTAIYVAPGTAGVIIDGFTIQGVTVSSTIAAIYMGAGSDSTTVRNNIIKNNTAGVFVENNSATTPTLLEKNLFVDNVAPGSASGNSIYADQTTTGGGLQNLIIRDNKFANTSVYVDSWAVGMSSTAPGGLLKNIKIFDNEVANHGRGIYLYGSDDVEVKGNTIVDTTNYAIGLFGGNSNVNIHDNILTNNFRAIYLEDEVGAAHSGPLTVTGDQITTQAGEYSIVNQSAGAVIATGEKFNGVLASGATNGQQYAIVDTIVDGVDVGGYGLVRTKAGEVFVTEDSFFAPSTTSASVQRGVNAASVGDIVNIQNGVYTGQVVVNKNLTLLGESEAGVVLKSPSTLTGGFTYTISRQSVVAITGGSVTVKNLTVDGDGQAAAVTSGGDFIGIGIHNADAVIDQVTVKGIRDSSLSGNQRGRAIFAGNTVGTHTVTVKNSTIFDYQKNGIDLRNTGTGLTAIITDNTITGAGVLGVNGQNGIVLIGGTNATVTGNTVTANKYDGSTATGILLIGQAGTTTINQNFIAANDTGVDTDSSVSVNNNFFVDNATGVYVESTTTGAVAVQTNSFVDAYVGDYNDSSMVGSPALIGLENASGIAVDATGNWWGSVNGPSGALNLTSGSPKGVEVKNSGAGSVTIAPWISDNGLDTETGTKGFQHGAVDTTPPATPTGVDLLTTSDSGASNTDNITKAANGSIGISVNYAGEQPVTLQLLVNGVVVASQFITGDATVTFSDLSGFPTDGTYSVTSRAIDLAGNVGAESAPLSVTIDRTAASLTVPSNFSVAEGTPTTLTGSYVNTGAGPISATPDSWLSTTGYNGQTITGVSGDTISFTPNDDGTATLTYRVVDTAGNESMASVIVTATNVAPTITIDSAPTSINENGTATIVATVVDPGSVETFAITVDWQDPNSAGATVITGLLSTGPIVTGTIGNTLYSWNPSTRQITLTHTYADDGVIGGNMTGSDLSVVSLSVEDDNSGISLAVTANITVSNVAPSGLAIAPNGLNVYEEGQTLNFTASATDNSNDVLTYTWTITGPGMTPSSGSGTSISFVPHDEGVYTIHLTVKDDDGGVTTDNFVVNTVVNVAPTITVDNANSIRTIDENQSATIVAVIDDPGSVETFSVTIDWKDLNAPGSVTITGLSSSASSSGAGYSWNHATRTITLTHQYLDDGISPGNGTATDISAVELSVLDGDGGLGIIAANSGDVTVKNKIATILSLNVTSPSAEFTPATLSGTYSDNGSLDVHTLFINWGDGSPIQQVGVSGGAFNVQHTYNSDATFTITATIKDDDLGESSPSSTSVVVTNVSLKVIAFQKNASGFDVQFNRALSLAELNLYDGIHPNAAVDLPDLSLVGAVSGTIKGSIVWNAATNTLSFVKTGGPLAVDTYTLTLKSGATAFKDTFGNKLDGDGNNIDPLLSDDYMTTFSGGVASTVRVVTVNDFARGPGQVVDEVAEVSGSKLAVRVNDSTALRSVDFWFSYDTSLLQLAAVDPITLGSAATTAGWTLFVDDLTPGIIKVTAYGSTALPAGTNTPIILIDASVPAGAPYGASQVLRITNTAINVQSGSLSLSTPSAGDHGIHKNVYLADADGNGLYDGFDAALISRVALGSDSGFGAHDWTDPVIVADADHSGTVAGGDASIVAQYIVAGSLQIPGPIIAVSSVTGGVDPKLSISDTLVFERGNSASIPVSITIDPFTTVYSATFDVEYSQAALNYLSVAKGADFNTSGWSLAFNETPAGTIKVTMFSATGKTTGASVQTFELAKLNFTVDVTAPFTTTDLNIIKSNTSEGGLSWTIDNGMITIADLTPPTVDIVDVTPDPRTTPVSSIVIVFSEVVSGFDLSDLVLSRNGGANLLTGAQTLTTSDGITWTLGNVGGLTGLSGSYSLTLVAGGSGIIDTAGNALATGAADSFVVNSTVASNGLHVFYNNSSWDGNNVAANSADNNAVAGTKTALLPGGTATFANYTSYSKGLNGIMIDLVGLGGTPTAGDFVFKTGNDNSPAGWATANSPVSVTVMPGMGVGGSDRVKLIWNDYSPSSNPANEAVANAWLQVTVLNTLNTGLGSNVVFYFGNAIGEVGNSSADATVNALDGGLVRNNGTTFLSPATIDNVYDINRDGIVNGIDGGLVRDNTTSFANDLELITVPTSSFLTASSGGSNASGRPSTSNASSLPATSVAGLQEASSSVGLSRPISSGSASITSALSGLSSFAAPATVAKSVDSLSLAAAQYASYSDADWMDQLVDNMVSGSKGKKKTVSI